MYTVQKFNLKTNTWEGLSPAPNMAIAQVVFGGSMLLIVIDNETLEVVLGFKGTDEEFVARYFETQFA